MSQMMMKRENWPLIGRRALLSARFSQRMRLNQAAIDARVPLVDAAQWGVSGTLIVVKPGETACLRCVYPTDPPFEELFPVVGGISAAIGAVAALEAIKIISKMGTPLFGRLWMIDSFQAQNSNVELRRDPNCVCCGKMSAAANNVA